MTVVLVMDNAAKETVSNCFGERTPPSDSAGVPATAMFVHLRYRHQDLSKVSFPPNSSCRSLQPPNALDFRQRGLPIGIEVLIF